MATTSKFDFGLINDQIKEHSDQIVNLGNALAYVINGNTYSGATIPNGSFVLWNGVLYTANGAIPAGSVSASNFSNLPARGGLNSLNNSLNNLVHTADITVTTSNTGSASLLTNRTVIMASTLEVDYVTIPVKTFSGTTWVKVFDWNMQLITNTQVTIRYYYI